MEDCVETDCVVEGLQELVTEGLTHHNVSGILNLGLKLGPQITVLQGIQPEKEFPIVIYCNTVLQLEVNRTQLCLSLYTCINQLSHIKAK